MKKQLFLIIALCSIWGANLVNAQGEATVEFTLDFNQQVIHQANLPCFVESLQNAEFTCKITIDDQSPSGGSNDHDNCITQDIYVVAGPQLYPFDTYMTYSLPDTYHLSPAMGNFPTASWNINFKGWEDDRGDRCTYDTNGNIFQDDDDCLKETNSTKSIDLYTIMNSFFNSEISSDEIYKWDFTEYYHDFHLQRFAAEAGYGRGWIGVTSYKFIAPASPLIPDCSSKSVSYSGDDYSVYGVSLEAGKRYVFGGGGIYGTDGITQVGGSYYTPSVSGVYFWLFYHNGSGSTTYRKESNVQLSLTATPSSLAGSEGTVHLSLSGQYSTPATFIWSNGATTQNLTGVPAGTYNVTVTDADYCTAIGVAQVKIDTCYYPKQLSYAVTNASAAGAADGAINLTVNNNALNGARTYTYLWSTGATTEDLTSVAAGIYDVTVTDNRGCITKGRTYVNLPHVNDGPLKLTLRVVQVFARDYNDVGDDADNTWLVSAKDETNVDGSDWLSSVCITKDAPPSGFIAGDGYRSAYSPVTIATFQYGVTTPQFYRLKIYAFEDDCGSRCSYESACGFLNLEGDDGLCNEEININIPFRHQPINQWNDDGWFYTYCGSATGPQYGVRVESKWEYTAIPANTTLDGPIRLEVRADYIKAYDYNDVTGSAENAWRFNVFDIADLDGQSDKQTCLYYSISTFPYTSPSAITIFDKVYPSLVPQMYSFTMAAWEDDMGDACAYEVGGTFSDGDDAYCGYTSPQFSFRVNPAGVWHLDATIDNLCSGAYGVKYSSRWSYINGDNPANPIPMGVVSCNTVRFVSTNTTTVYTHNATSPLPSKDVYYQFELKEPADVIITTCNPATNYDSYLYLTNLAGTVINQNDDFNYPTSLCSKITQNNLPAGKYNIIVEGYGSGEGLFELSVDAVPHPVIDIANLPAVVCVHADTISLVGNPPGGTFSGAGVYHKDIKVTYSVDMTSVLGGIPFSADGMKIRGNFADLNASANGLPMSNWWDQDDASCAMTDMGNNIWSITVTYPSSSIGVEQRYLFGNGYYGYEEFHYLWDCGVQIDVETFNRTLVIPNFNTTKSYCYGDCNLCSGVPAADVVSAPEYFFIADNAGVGTHTITYTGINSNGCTATVTKNITVAPLPDASFSGLSDTICPTADSLTLAPVTAGGYFFGNGTTNSSFFFHPAFAALGENSVTYTVTDNNGCINSKADTVVVFQSITNQAVQLCAGDSLFVQGAWQKGSGIYFDTLTTAGGCDSIIVTELDIPVPLQLFFNVVNVSQAGNDGSISLNTVGGYAPYSYLWSNTDTTKDIASLAVGTYYITVTDSNNCIALDSVAVVSAVKISGALLTEQGNPLHGVVLTLSGSEQKTDTTGVDGIYNFTMGQGATVNVVPAYKDTFSPACISAVDLVIMRRHILAIDTLDAPYKIMTGDVNASGTVSTIDIGIIRGVILGNDSVFPGGRLWRFMRSDFNFTDTLQPFPFDTSRSYASLATDTLNQNFTAIRLGDVNGNCDIPNPRLSVAGEVKFGMEEYNKMPGDEVTVPVKVKHFNGIAGYQYTLSWNHEVLSFLEVNNVSLSAFYGTRKTGDGLLTTVWSDETGGAKSLGDEAVAFEIKFRVVGSIGTFSEIKIGSEITQSEAYNDGLELLFINATNGRVNIGQATDINNLTSNIYSLSVQPNPFNHTTNIIFSLQKDEKVILEIFDLLGKAVKRIQVNYKAGEHKIEWEGDDQNGIPLSAGMYHIRMTAGSEAKGVKVALVR